MSFFLWLLLFVQLIIYREVSFSIFFIRVYLYWMSRQEIESLKQTLRNAQKQGDIHDIVCSNDSRLIDSRLIVIMLLEKNIVKKEMKRVYVNQFFIIKRKQIHVWIMILYLKVLAQIGFLEMLFVNQVKFKKQRSVIIMHQALLGKNVIMFILLMKNTLVLHLVSSYFLFVIQLLKKNVLFSLNVPIFQNYSNIIVHFVIQL